MCAHASGPRYVTGPPFFTGAAGVPVGWKQSTLLYYTDPGNLSANVNHQAADALVTAAAGVWNVPVASITLSQGGSLAEHVSGNNVYLDSAGMHLPADARSTNAAAIPVAVIYDTDGSVTDTLLGAGASDPSSCRQNAVTESVDRFDPAGYILHALIVINGRCTGSAPQAQLQLKYQLMRVFGRVLGLAWSQTNDNVFTGTPRSTALQAQNWPILHPVDILCGLYTYQCLPNPFQLRIDDIAALVAVYPIANGSQPGSGKQPSLNAAEGVNGTIRFPTGQGMAGVNVLVRREAANTATPDAFYVGSAVTGMTFRQQAASPFVAVGSDAAASMGSTDTDLLGHYAIAYFPMLRPSDAWQNLLTSTEPINPLYTGEYSLGPYAVEAVAPAGSAVGQTNFVTTPQGSSEVDYLVGDAPSTCGQGGDGVQNGPMEAPGSGWWTGLLCGYGHASYVTASVKPARSLTIEITALDEQGFPTEAKAMPVIGLYGANDAVGALPSLGATATAFNAPTVGTTSMMAQTGAATAIEFGIADERGDGRPDFSYQARLFYADSISPARIAANGGVLTISGMGFRNGNAVSINGVAAHVLSWSSNTIVVSALTMSAALATSGNAVDVTVTDRTTGAVTTMSAALTYDVSATLPNTMRIVTAPAGSMMVGDPASVPFSVQVMAADGVTPVIGDNVIFQATAGLATFGACGGAVCTVITDANGMASTTVAAAAAGLLVVQASDAKLQQSINLTGVAQASKMLLFSAPESSIKVGTSSINPMLAWVSANGYSGLPSVPVTLFATQGNVSFDKCAASPCTLLTDQYGLVVSDVTPHSAGPITIEATYGDLTQTASFTGVSNLDTMRISLLPSDIALGGSTTYAVVLLQSDGVTPDPNRMVTFNAPAGVSLGQCGSSTCALATDYTGQATIILNPAQVGTFTIQASYGALLQTASFKVQVPVIQMKVLSLPSDQSSTGVVASVPFAVQLLQPDGMTPIRGVNVTLAGTPNSSLLMACYSTTCELPVDSNGVVSTLVTPIQAGTISLSATFLPLTKTVSFTAAGQGESISVVAQPGAGGAPFGTLETMTVKIAGPDGLPMPWDLVTFSVLSGPFALLGNAAPAMRVFTDAHGLASVQGLAVGSGPAIVQATDGVVSQQIAFQAGTSADVVRLVSAPVGPAVVGQVLGVPFTVQVFSSDGITPQAGKKVTFTVTNGSASFGACAATLCVVTTNASGIASTPVTPTSAGTISLLAADGTAAQATTFVATAPPDILRVQSSPANGAYTGVTAALPLTVQVLKADGVTFSSGAHVSLSESSGAATFAACGGLATCIVTSDSQGLVTTAVTPSASGTISLTIAEGGTSTSVNFTAVDRPDVMRLVSAPTGINGVGYPAPQVFTVQVVSGDGLTPRVGKSVSFSVTSGVAQFAGCVSGICSIVTGADGTASVSVTPLQAGQVALVATVGTLTQSASFQAVVLPDVLRIVSAPASGGLVGSVASTALAVQVMLADGVTPATGRTVTVAVTNGSAALKACNGAPMCSLQSDNSGLVESAVTPQSAGVITLHISDGQAVQDVSFTALQKPDTMRLLTAPSGSLATGVVAGTSFTVLLMQGDGVTPDAGRTVVFSATGNTVQFGACAQAICSVVTGNDGTATTTVTPQLAGPITLMAAVNSLSQSASFTAFDRPDVMQLLSAPADGSYTGVAASQSYAVRVLKADGVTPSVGARVTLSVSSGSATFGACNGPLTCVLTVDNSGTVSTTVVPVSGGAITLLAAEGTTTQVATFNAIVRPDVLRLVSAPTDSSYTGVPAGIALAAQLLRSDGTTPDAGVGINVVITGGSASLSGCIGATPCVLTTDQNGMLTTSVTPLAPGIITILLTHAQTSLTVSFTAQALSSVLQIVSAPASGSWTGVAASVPFKILLLQGDGRTPAIGKNVTVKVTQGSAALAACGGGSTCALTTDATGNVSTVITPSSAGTIVLSATQGAVTQTASFVAADRADSLQIASAPASGSYVGLVTGQAFSVRVLLGDGDTPAAGKQVTVSVTSGQAGLSACGGSSTCVVTADASGLVSTGVVPQSAGNISLSAVDGAAVQTVSFTAVARPDVLTLVTAPASPVRVGAQASQAFAVRLLAADGVTPLVGVAVVFTSSSASVQWSGCSASQCTVLTAADGMAALMVTPASAGPVTLVASVGSLTQSASFFAQPDQYSLSASTPALYVAEGSTMSFTLVAQATENGSPAASQTVHWTGTAAFQPMQADTMTDASGITSVTSSVGPLGANAQMTAQACAWTATCATFMAEGVASAELHIAMVSGAGQTLTSGIQFQPVLAQVSDGAGHPVAGAPVTVYQTVTGQVACPDRGRCPAAPVLASQVIVLASDATGRVNIVPLTDADMDAASTQIAMATGTSGYVTTTLSRGP